MTVDDEPRRAGIGLDDIFGLGAGVFKAGGRMAEDCLVEDFIEVGGFEFEMAIFIDF